MTEVWTPKGKELPLNERRRGEVLVAPQMAQTEYEQITRQDEIRDGFRPQYDTNED